MSIRLAIAGYVAHAGKPCTSQDMHQAVPGFSVKQMQNAISSAVKKGWIKPVGKQGVFTAYEPGVFKTYRRRPVDAIPVVRMGDVPSVPASVWELPQFGWPAERKPRNDFATMEHNEE